MNQFSLNAKTPEQWLELMSQNYPHSPGFKTVQTETSAQAAAEIKTRAATLRDKCLIALARTPLTADEVAERLNENILSIRPRLSELNKMSKIEDSGLRRENWSGKKAVVWRAIRKETQPEFNL